MLATAGAAAVAIAGTLVVYAAHVRMLASAMWKSAAWASTILALGAVYVLQNVAMIAVLHWQYGDDTFIYPGAIERIIPIVDAAHVGDGTGSPRWRFGLR